MNNNFLKYYNRGQTIVEVLIAAGLIALIFPVLAQGFTLSRNSSINREARHEALLLMQESLDAIRTIRETGWSQIASNGTYHPEINGSNWSLEPGSEQIGNYTRQLVIDDTQRDIDGNIIPIGGTVDPSTKKVTHLISWEEPVTGQIEYITYITRYLGNATNEDTTTSDFSGGTFNNTQTNALIGNGAVELMPPTLTNSFIDEYNTPADYTYNSAKIEVTGGYAQLKQDPNTEQKTTTNSGFDSGSTGWTYVDIGKVSSTGNYVSTGGNPGGYINSVQPRGKNFDSYGYWQQPFTVAYNNEVGHVNFQWKVISYSGTPLTFRVRVWVDNFSGGTPSNMVWGSGAITGVTSWSATQSVDVSSSISTSGTYYLKIGSYIDYPKGTNVGPYTSGYDNVLLSHSTPTPKYPKDSPDIYPIDSFSALRVDSWDSFSSTESLDGGSINYQLSDNDGSSWYYYSGGWTSASSASQSNSASTVNTNIGTFNTSNNQIKVRAFLTSNGWQFVRLDNVTIGYTGIAETNTGTYESASFDSGQLSAFNNFFWNEVNTADTTTNIQIATNTDNSTWTFIGPDGTSGTYFLNEYGIVPLGAVSGRYFKYKIYFESISEDQPYVEDFSVNYSP